MKHKGHPKFYDQKFNYLLTATYAPAKEISAHETPMLHTIGTGSPKADT